MKELPFYVKKKDKGVYIQGVSDGLNKKRITENKIRHYETKIGDFSFANIRDEILKIHRIGKYDILGLVVTGEELEMISQIHRSMCRHINEQSFDEIPILINNLISRWHLKLKHKAEGKEGLK